MRRAILLTVALGLLGFSLVPTLEVGFVSDDALRSLRPGERALNGEGQFEYLSRLSEELRVGAGRFMPLHFLLYTTSWTSEVRLHRWLSLLLVMAAASMLALYLWRVAPRWVRIGEARYESPPISGATWPDQRVFLRVTSKQNGGEVLAAPVTETAEASLRTIGSARRYCEQADGGWTLDEIGGAGADPADL